VCIRRSEQAPSPAEFGAALDAKYALHFVVFAAGFLVVVHLFAVVHVFGDGLGG
jgi:hypothetical protein